jgi:hypothetical protein
MKVATIVVTVSLLSLLLIPMGEGDTTLTLEHKENFTIYTNTWEHPIGLVGSDSGYNITNGDKLFVSWNVTKNSLLLPPIVWLLTVEQRNHFSQIIGGPSLAYGYILKSTAWEGNFSFSITQNGTYCVIIHNPNWGALDISGPTLNAEVYNAILTIPALPPPTPPPTPVGGYSVSVEGHGTPLLLSVYLITLIMLSSIFISTKRKMRKHF